MKISPYLKLNRIEFMITYYCTGKCLHCSVADKLGKCDGSSHVKSNEAVRAIECLTKYFPISSVMTFGGEPLLYPNTVCDIHRTAAGCGIEKRQIITNGYFSKDEERIAAVAHELCAAGVNDILLSVDAFHQKTIPLEPVMCFAQNAKQAGCRIRLQPAWIVNQQHENKYNGETKSVLAKFEGTGLPIASGNDIFLAGNAAKHLAEYYPAPSLDLSAKCGSAPYTDPLTEISSLSIVPNGDVMICSFVIGNIYEESMEEIIARYDPYENEYMRAILTGGVPALLDAAQRRGVSPDITDCRSICDVCKKICR